MLVKIVEILWMLREPNEIRELYFPSVMKDGFGVVYYISILMFS